MNKINIDWMKLWNRMYLWSIFPLLTYLTHRLPYKILITGSPTLIRLSRVCLVTLGRDGSINMRLSNTWSIPPNMVRRPACELPKPYIQGQPVNTSHTGRRLQEEHRAGRSIGPCTCVLHCCLVFTLPVRLFSFCFSVCLYQSVIYKTSFFFLFFWFWIYCQCPYLHIYLSSLLPLVYLPLLPSIYLLSYLPVYISISQGVLSTKK